MTGRADGFTHPVDFYFAFFNSASSSFISAISTFSFSSHSSRVCAYTFRACFLPSIHVGVRVAEGVDALPLAVELFRQCLLLLRADEPEDRIAVFPYAVFLSFMSYF